MEQWNIKTMEFLNQGRNRTGGLIVFRLFSTGRTVMYPARFPFFSCDCHFSLLITMIFHLFR